MTKKNLISILLIAFYTIAMLIFGCIPEDSLTWSADGSAGILSKKGALFLVDGNTGSLTQIAKKETTTGHPAISVDGKSIAYGRIVNVANFNDALNMLPPGQVKIIKANADILKQKILAEGLDKGKFPLLGKARPAHHSGSKDSFNEQHLDWVHRCLVENADSILIEKIGSALIEKTKEKELLYFRLILASTSDPKNEKTIATNAQKIWRTRFSPNGRLLAYVTDRINGDTFETGFDLYVTPVTNNATSALVAQAIAIGYDWRHDSRAITYLESEKKDLEDQDFIIGSLVEKTVADSNGKLILQAVNPDSETSFAAYNCTGPEEELGGVLFHSWMYVAYARDGRIFFSTAKMTLPSSKIDEEKGSLFCYDSLTGAITEILPQIALDYAEDNIHLFALSHDSKKLLLTGNKNTLGIYALGKNLDSSKILIDENESFGDDSPPKMAPAWKGPDQLTCLVAENSHYLSTDPNTPHHRREIVVLDCQGELKQVLSKSWPDELLKDN